MKESWEHKTIEELSVVACDGDWIESKDQSPHGIRLVQTGNVGEGYYKDKEDKARFVSESTFKRLNCTEIFEGDCLVSRLPDPVGRSCVLPDLKSRAITAVDCTIIRFDTKLMIPDFFVYYTLSPEYLASVERLCTGATRKRISRKNLLGIEIPAPPIVEQKKIIAELTERFNTTDALIDVLVNKISTVNLLKKSYLQEAFAGKL